MVVFKAPALDLWIDWLITQGDMITGIIVAVKEPSPDSWIDVSESPLDCWLGFKESPTNNWLDAK